MGHRKPGIARRILDGMIAGAERRGRHEAHRHLAWLSDAELRSRGLTRMQVEALRR